MIFFTKKAKEKGILKLFKSVDLNEANQLQTKKCMDVCIVFFEDVLKKSPNHFDLNFETIKAKDYDDFKDGLEKTADPDIMYLVCWELKTESFVSITNGIVGKKSVDKDYIEISVKVTDIKPERLILFLKKLYPLFGFDYGYFLELPSNYHSSTERKIRKSIFGTTIVKHTKEDIEMSNKLEDVDKNGFYKKIYSFNIFNKYHVLDEKIKVCMHDHRYKVEKLNNSLHVLYLVDRSKW